MKRTPLYMAMAGLTLSAAATFTQAQDQVIEEVVVTGSYIAGSPEDAAVPVDVITAEDMSKAGSPDMLQFIKDMPASSGVLGDSNQFDGKAQGADGAGSVNLRGLGPQRTLVLVNGRRMANNSTTGAVDTNLLPLAAFGRVEVLKDGAAVLYGSDAIAGVVNFITKKDFEGIEIGGDHKFIEGSNGDTTLKANWGWVGDDSNVLVSLGYQKRSRLSVADRDWGMLPFEANEQGGWSGASNPAGFISLSAGGDAGQFNDPGCADLGGTALDSPVTGTDGTVPRCRFEYTPFENLVDPMDRYQLFSEYNTTFGSDIDFHLEGLYSKTETDYFTSPSYLATQAASGPFGSPYYSIPAAHPAMAAFVAAYPLATTKADTTGAPTGDVAALTTNGLLLAQLTFRPFALGGNPEFNNGAALGEREHEQYRVSTGLNGSISDSINWDVNLTYSEVTTYREQRDTIANHFQAALRGLGGPNCAAGSAAGDPGCFWYNPFSTAIQYNALTGQLNPNYDAANANNNSELNNWMFASRWDETKVSNLTFDAVFSGDIGVELAGGDIQWAAGVQYRDDSYDREVSDNQNLDINNCPDAALNAFNTTNSCTGTENTGIFFFLGGSRNSSLDQDVSAIFTEWSLPILDTLEVNLALRYEDYGDTDTTDPKLAVRWQATDWMAIRGSYSSTFRAPTQLQQESGSATSLQLIGKSFRAIDTYGNADLIPESADAYGFGFIFNPANFNATLDYWRFDLEDTLTTDPLGGMVDTLFGAGGTDNCGNAAYAALEARFTFSGACGIANVARVETYVVNGSSREIDGIDFSISNYWDLSNGDVVTLGTQGSYTLGYDLEDVFVDGVLVESARDATGYLNAQTSAYPLPELKGQVYGEYTKGDANFRLVSKYTDEYIDQRYNVPVDSQLTWDFHYRYLWNTDLAETVINVSVENLTDKDPSFARLDLDYDPFTGNALGRTFKVGVSAKF